MSLSQKEVQEMLNNLGLPPGIVNAILEEFEGTRLPRNNSTISLNK